MSKRRASKLSTKRLEILGLVPNKTNSLYDANRNKSTLHQDKDRLSMVESIFNQCKKTASDDIKNGIPEILQYDESSLMITKISSKITPISIFQDSYLISYFTIYFLFHANRR